MDLLTAIHADDYEDYLGSLGAEYVRQGGSGKVLFYLHDVGLWCVAMRSGDSIRLSYFEDESDCGC